MVRHNIRQKMNRLTLCSDASMKILNQIRAYSVGTSMPSPRNLWDIVKKDIFEKHDANQIKDIWAEFHSDISKNRLATVLPAPQYLKFTENATSSPMMVLPVFKGPNAFEMFFIQHQLPHVLITSLEAYKQQGPSSPPVMSLTHYSELAGGKGLVLVRGDVLTPTALTRLEASTLMRLTHEFYLDPRKHAFVRSFNHKPSEFDLKRMMDSMGHDTSQLPRN